MNKDILKPSVGQSFFIKQISQKELKNFMICVPIIACQDLKIRIYNPLGNCLVNEILKRQKTEDLVKVFEPGSITKKNLVNHAQIVMKKITELEDLYKIVNAVISLKYPQK